MDFYIWKHIGTGLKVLSAFHLKIITNINTCVFEGRNGSSDFPGYSDKLAK